jgi:polysaccharide deacetylase 2 family uncharacterized protein YibQ
MARKPAKTSANKRKPVAKARKTARKPSRRLPLVAAIALFAAVLAVAAVVVLLPGEDAAAPQVTTTRPPLPAPQRPAPKQPAPLKAAQPPAVTEAPAVTLSPPPQLAAVPPRPKPVWEQNAVPVAVKPGQPMIAIVIDDMGIDRNRSAQAAALPGPLTLAYLAYADDLSRQTAQARTAGHELLAHVPMEPSSASTDPGPNALLTTLSGAELARRIAWNLDQFGGFVGINNHMGSKATSDAEAMRAVMAELSKRGLLFLDSRTSGATVARDEAERTGIPALKRDVFLDHDPSPIAVRAALLKTEKTAEEQGYAIAIGHPKDATIAALAEWLPDVKARGFAIVPVSALALRSGTVR